MNVDFKKRLFLFLRIAISLGLIGYIFYQISSEYALADLPRYYAGANYLWLVGALLLLLLLLAGGAMRWGMLLAAQGVKLSPASVFMYFMIGMFFNNFLPSTVGGDVIKIYYLSKFTHRGPESFISVLIDRIMGMAGLCVVALCALLWGGKNLWEAVGRQKALLIFLIVGGLSLSLVLFFLVVFNDKFMGFFFRLVRWEKIHQKVRRLHNAVYVYKGQRGVLLRTLLLSTGIWVVIVVVCWMVYMAFHAPSLPTPPGKIAFIPIRYFFLFLPTISVIMSLPISFAGLGTREACFILFFKTLPGIKDIDALIISLNFYFVFLAASAVGGIIYILKDQLRFHREEIQGQQG